jgi:hypothetical protein
MAAPDTGKSSGEVLEVGPGSDRSNELTRSLIANHKHDSHGGNPESHEGPNPDAHRTVADVNTPPPLVSQVHTLESELNSAPSSDDVIPTSRDEPVARRTNEHEKQTPAAFQASLPPEAAFDEVGPLKATGEVTPADQSIDPSGKYPLMKFFFNIFTCSPAAWP